MDFSDGRSPRRELQGPRPAPLKVRKDSHKIRKPPMAPQQAAHHAPPNHHPSHAPPVIIYTVSPKIIHADPNEFMSLVQRLTGPNSSPSTSALPFQESGGAISPAARFASIEKTNRSPDGRKQQGFDDGGGVGFVEGIEIERRTGQFPGILSPNPNALPTIVPPNFFSINPTESNNPLNYFHDFSPGGVLLSNRNVNNYSFDHQNSFMLQQSPSTNFMLNTPSPNTLDLFHSLFDL